MLLNLIAKFRSYICYKCSLYSLFFKSLHDGETTLKKMTIMLQENNIHKTLVLQINATLLPVASA